MPCRFHGRIRAEAAVRPRLPHTGVAGVKLNKRLVLQLSFLLLATCTVMGMVGHAVARRELGQKGETILRNSVSLARVIVRSYQEQVHAGILTEKEAKERVKVVLIGQRNEDGSRGLIHVADMGEHGYFLIYDRYGNEVMHPTLEGRNMWEAQDPKRPGFHLVQDQIAKAMEGGGFTEYYWELPNSRVVAQKISYGEYEPTWGWILCATAYRIDFDKGANAILTITLVLAVLSLCCGIVIAWEFVRRVTVPVEGLVEAMRRAVRFDGSRFLVRRNGSLRTDEIGRLVEGYNRLISDKDAAQEKLLSSEQAMIRLAYFDDLSTLPNRNHFRKTVEDGIADGVGHAVFLLMDIRNFRLINTLYGESFGDDLIRMAGQMLNDYQSKSNMIARFSGDEFAGWAIEWEDGAVARNIGGFRRMLQERVARDGIDLRIDLRTGYALYPDHGTDFEALLKHATVAVRQAKALGSNAIVEYTAEMHASLAREERIRQLLEQAIDDRAFRLVYQAKVMPGSGRVAGVEALARWDSPELGSVSPTVFIPMVEAHGMITRFGEMVIELAMADWARLEAKYGDTFTLSINLSPEHLFDGNLEGKLFAEIRRNGVDASRVLLEITENARIDDFNRIRTIMDKLREFGIRFSLDDFGTGYSSLSYIRQLPLDELKIDREFVDGLLFDSHAPVLLDSICRMARSYGLKVVAEGVETADQERMLLTAGIDLVQGYLYARPEPLD